MKRLLMGIGATALAALLLTLITPKAAHALVAALVQVSNTTANPVPNADVDAPGEEPFQTQICNSVGSGAPGCGSTPSDFTVPATTTDGLTVKRLVVEQLSVGCNPNGASHIQTSLSFQTSQNRVNGTVFSGTIWLPLVAGTSLENAVSSMTVRAYADVGSGPSWFIEYQGDPSTTGVSCTYTIVGSLLTH